MRFQFGKLELEHCCQHVGVTWAVIWGLLWAHSGEPGGTVSPLDTKGRARGLHAP